MNWFEKLNRDVISYDLLLRNPLEFNNFSFNEFKSVFSDLNSNLTVSFSKSNDKILESFVTYSFFNEISKNKVFLKITKGFSGKKIHIFSLNLKKRKCFMFLDFFLNLFIKGLKRRFIVLNHSLDNNGILNLRFSSLGELEVDEFFSFSLEIWKNSLNYFLKFSKNKNLSMLYNLIFIYYFNLNKLIKYEVFNRKG